MNFFLLTFKIAHTTLSFLLKLLDQYGPKLSKIVQYGSKWFKIIQNSPTVIISNKIVQHDSKWSNSYSFLNCPKWSNMVHYGTKMYKIVLNDPEWCKMAPKSPECQQIVLEMSQSVLNISKWPKLALGNLCVLFSSLIIL